MNTRFEDLVNTFDDPLPSSSATPELNQKVDDLFDYRVNGIDNDASIPIKKKQQKKVETSELLAEARADQVLQQNGYRRLDNDNLMKGKTGQFDRIYINDSTGEIIFVEAKGGGSTLGARTTANGEVAQQGTREYMNDIIANMENKLGDDHLVMETIQNARQNAQIRYVLVRQGVDRKDNFIIRDFPI